MHLRHIPPGRSHGTDGEEGRRPDPGSPCRLRRRSRAGVALCHLPWRANPGPAPLPTVKTGAGGAGWDVSGAPSARGQPAGRGGLPQGLRSSAFRQHRTGSGPPDLRNSGERLCGYPRPPRLQPRGAPRRPRPAVPPAAAAVKGDTFVVGAGRSWLHDRRRPRALSRRSAFHPDCKHVRKCWDQSPSPWMLSHGCRCPLSPVTARPGPASSTRPPPPPEPAAPGAHAQPRRQRVCS